MPSVASLVDVGCVVVHHQNYPGVLRTIDRILACGISPHKLVVVDNSENLQIEAALVAELPEGVELAVVPNHGYGQAVNYGIDIWGARGIPKYLLVATHEVLPEVDAVELLLNALEHGEEPDVAGPTLVSFERDHLVVWSKGGYLTALLGLPGHRGAGDLVGRERDVGPAQREWLDGAFCLYRSSIFEQHRLREDFFMYSEELEFHVRIRNAGSGIVYVPGAVVQQSTGGTPQYYLARNLYLYQRAWGNWFRRIATMPYLFLQQLAKSIVRQNDQFEGKELLRGWHDGRIHWLGEAPKG